MKNLASHINNLALILVALFPPLLFLGNAPVDVCISTVSILFIVRSFLTKDFSWLKYTWVKLALAFWFYTIIRALFASDVWLATTAAFVYIRFILFAVAIGHWVSSLKNSQNFFLKSTLATLLIIVFNTLIQYIFGNDVFGNVVNYESYPRLLTPMGKLSVGIMSCSIAFPAIVYLLHLSLNSQDRLFKKFMATALVILIILTIYISGERSAFIGSVIGLALLVLIDKKIRKFSLYIFGVCLVGLTLFSVYNHKVFSRQFDLTYHEVYNFKNSSYGQIYTKGVELFSEHPLFGIGTRHYRIDCPKKYGKEALCSLHPHNNFIEVLVETGVIGAVLFFGAIVAWLKDFYFYRRSIQANILALGALINVLVKLIPILPSASLHIAWATGGIWLMLGWVYGCIWKKQR